MACCVTIGAVHLPALFLLERSVHESVERRFGEIRGARKPSIESLSEVRSFDPPGATRKYNICNMSDNRLSKYRRLLFSSDASVYPGSLPCEVLELDNVLVTGQGFVIFDDMFIADSQFAPPFWESGHCENVAVLNEVLIENSIYCVNIFDQTISINFPKESEIHILDKKVFLFDVRYGSKNFGHFVHDTMTLVPTFIALASEDRILSPFFACRNFKFPIMEATLETLLGSEKSSWNFFPSKVIRIKKLVLPCKHVDFMCWNACTGAVRRLRAEIDKAFPPPIPSQRKNIYISRNDGRRAAKNEVIITNSDEMTDILRKWNFETVESSRLSVSQYFDIFRNCNIMAGVHGAGLMNFIFSPTSKLVELVFEGFPGWLSVSFYAEVAGTPNRRIVHQTPNGRNVEVDLVAFEAAISEVANL